MLCFHDIQLFILSDERVVVCTIQFKICCACLLFTWYDSLFEELLPQVGQEADNSFPGDLPQV